MGWQRGGSITASYATGNVDGGSGNQDRIGVLVGAQSGGFDCGQLRHGQCRWQGRKRNDNVGALVGQQDQRFNHGQPTPRAMPMAGAETGDYAGALVGQQDQRFNHGQLRHGQCRWRRRKRVTMPVLWWASRTNGSITASYATGNAAGGGGNDNRVGALVGRQEAGSITASYATGNAAGGGGNDDFAGALVGQQTNGSITASYATGNAAGGGGSSDFVGALVGWQDNGGSITASYATGPADGGGGTGSSAGALVGRQESGLITASYGFGPTTGGLAGVAGSARPDESRGGPADLTADNAGAHPGTQASSNTLGAWDFGTTSQIPALKYADYDGDGGTTLRLQSVSRRRHLRHPAAPSGGSDCRRLFVFDSGERLHGPRSR